MWKRGFVGLAAAGTPSPASDGQASGTALPNRPGGLALALLMLGVFADHHHAALALDDLALFADGLHRRTDFHG